MFLVVDQYHLYYSSFFVRWFCFVKNKTFELEPFCLFLDLSFSSLITSPTQIHTTSSQTIYLDIFGCISYLTLFFMTSLKFYTAAWAYNEPVIST